MMDRIDLCDKKMKELFNGTINKGEGTNPELQQILQKFLFGEVCYAGTFNDKMREMITVAILAAYQCLPQLKLHLFTLMNTGATPLEAREVLYQLMPFIGLPKTLNAVAVLDEVLVEKNVDLPLPTCSTVNEETRFEEGKKIQTALYGEEIKENYAHLPSPYNTLIPNYLTSWNFGDFYTRKGLDNKMRELLGVVLLSALGCSELLASQVKGCLQAGNDKETILNALVQALPYIGIPSFQKALNAIQDLLSME